MNENDPKVLFEQAAQRLDAASANRLRLARRSALAGASGAAPSRAWKPALALAAVLALGLAWWLPQRGAGTPARDPAPAPAALASDEVVLPEVDDDSELYAWLAEAPVASEPEGKEQAL